MITTEQISLNNETRNKLKISIEETKKVIDQKYQKYTVIMLTLIEFLILFLIYLYEDYGFSVILKLLTIIPIWAIIVITIKYYQKWIPAKKIYKFHSKILNANGYDALRIKSNRCDNYNDGINDYYLFETNPNEIVLFRKQDFNIDMTNFPNNDFIIPPYELFDIVGNTIVCKGQAIKPNEDKGYIKKVLVAFRIYDTGQIMIQNKN